MKALPDISPVGGSSRPRSGRSRHVPFSVHLGIAVDSATDGVAVVSMDLEPHMLNNHGAGHGGVVMALLDVAMANAALSKVDYTREVVTVDMSVGFIGATEGRVVATGRAVGGGRSICFCEARIVDANGELAAQAMGTFRYRDPVREVR
jgi:uncharacterized protein (TIGR00369 family)